MKPRLLFYAITIPTLGYVALLLLSALLMRLAEIKAALIAGAR